jgi:hypothetical protein
MITILPMKGRPDFHEKLTNYLSGFCAGAGINIKVRERGGLLNVECRQLDRPQLKVVIDAFSRGFTGGMER